VVTLLIDRSARVSYDVLTDDLPDAVLYAPVVARVTGVYPFAIVELRGSSFPSRDAKAAQAGESRAAIVPRDITGEPLYWD
jgi:hypothetical protein